MVSVDFGNLKKKGCCFFLTFVVVVFGDLDS